MINLENLRLEDIAPDSIKIPDVLAFFNALDPELQEITRSISEVLIMTRIDEMPEEIVDLLAWQLHVDFYEPLGLDLDRKRALVKNSLIWHRYKGTKYALESMIRILFFDDFQVEEWFEYEGKPYFFRIVSNVSFNGTAADLWQQHRELFMAIWEMKNERSWLDYIMFVKKMDPTPVVIVGKHKHAVKHFHHPGERNITQNYDVDKTPVVVAGKTKHAVKHISTTQERGLTHEHAPDVTPVIPTVITKHAVQHTATAVHRSPNRPSSMTPVLSIPAGIAVHAVKHIATPVRNTMAEKLMFVELEDGSIWQGFVEIDGVIQPGFVELITEGA